MTSQSPDPVQVVVQEMAEINEIADYDDAERIVAALRAAGHIPDPETHTVIAKADLPTRGELLSVLAMWVEDRHSWTFEEVAGWELKDLQSRWPSVIRDEETA